MQPGCKLLHYEVLAKLGEGGMGEVYRARDTREAAIAAMRRAIELTGESIPFLSCYLAAMHFFFGQEEEGERQLERIAEMEKTLPRSGLGWIVLEAARGDTDAAIAELERGVTEHDTLTCWSRALCEQQGLIRDERLREAMARAGLP